MTKQETLDSRVDLKQFFEASINALQHESRSERAGSRTDLRHAALVQRAATDATPKNRAVADAARALTALWKIHPTRTNGPLEGTS
jgi:hypothetical protein